MTKVMGARVSRRVGRRAAAEERAMPGRGDVVNELGFQSNLEEFKKMENR